MSQMGSVPQHVSIVRKMNFCPQCGTKVEKARYCCNCGKNLDSSSYALSSTSPAVPTLPQLKRPLGIAIMCVLWFFGGLVNLFGGLAALGDEVDVLSKLYNPYWSFPEEVKPWASWAIPLETTLVLFTTAIGLLQLTTIYGLWKGKSWSYKYGTRIMAALITIGWIETFLLMMAPRVLNLQPDLLTPLATTVFGAIYITYLKRTHVKEYLGVP